MDYQPIINPTQRECLTTVKPFIKYFEAIAKYNYTTEKSLYFQQWYA